MDAIGESCIVIPFKDQWPLLAQCLQSLVAAKVSIPVVLMDTGSTEETLKQAADYCAAAPINVQLQPFPGLGGLTTDWFDSLVGLLPDAFIILNSDTIVTPGFDRRLLESLGENPLNAAVAPVSTTPADLFQYRPGFDDESGPLVKRIMGFAQKRLTAHRGETTEAPFLGFTCIALNTNYYRKAEAAKSPFEGAHYYDLDMTALLRSFGGRLLVREDTVIWHKGHGTYQTMDQEALYNDIQAREALFAERWGHLPEYRALMERIQFSALYHANHGRRSIQG